MLLGLTLEIFIALTFDPLATERKALKWEVLKVKRSRLRTYLGKLDWDTIEA